MRRRGSMIEGKMLLERSFGILRLMSPLWVVRRRGRAVSAATPFLTAPMAISGEHGGDLQLYQLLWAMTHQFRDELTGCAAFQ